MPSMTMRVTMGMMAVMMAVIDEGDNGDDAGGW